MAEVYELMREAMFLVFLSQWDKTFSKVTIKAFTKGTLVRVSVSEAITSDVDYRSYHTSFSS